MYFAIYSVYILVFITKPGLADMHDGFFGLESEPNKIWNLSSDFFGRDSEKLSNVPTLMRNDQLPERVVNSVEEMSGDVADIDDLIGQFDGAAKTVTKSNHSTTQCILKDKEDLIYKAYFIRFINIFLRNTGFADYSGTIKEDYSKIINDDGSETITIDMILSKKDLTILKKFGSGDDISLEVLENSFSSLLCSVTNDHSSQTFEILPHFYNIILILSLLAAIYIIYLTTKLNLTKSMFIFTLCAIYILLVALDLLQQYEDIGEQIILKRLEFEHITAPPKECFLSKIPYYQKLYFYIFSDDTCSRYLQSRKSVWHQIDVASAFSKPIHLTFMKLCSLLGEGAEKIIKPFADKCPWPINGVLYFLLSILQLPVLIFSLCIIISALSFGRITLSIPFFSIKSERGSMNENCCLSNPKSKEAIKGVRPSKGTQIINHGGIVLLADSDSALQRQIFGGNKEHLNLGGEKGPVCYEKSIFSQNTDNVQEVEGIKNSFKWNKQSLILDEYNDQSLLQKGGCINNRTKTEINKTIEDTSINKSLPLHFSINTKTVNSDNIFNGLRPFLQERNKLKKKNFKRTVHLPYKLKNITNTCVKDLCIPYATK